MDKDCMRCAYGTKVDSDRIYCMFSSCPYTKQADPFGELAMKERHSKKKGGNTNGNKDTRHTPNRRSPSV